MKRISILIMSLVLTLGVMADDLSAFNGLVGRLLPNLSSQIEGKKLPAKKTGDYFQLSTENGKLIVGGNNANSMAVGLNYYLKYHCNTVVSWFVDEKFDAPKAIVPLNETITIDARVKDRFFLNYCTFGYTMPWWNWRDWEHFIDWMALNGVNLPLAITGQESIWRKVWMKMGLTDEEVRAYFTGPAHLPWHRMMNIDYWPGQEGNIKAVPMSWLNDQEELQKKIVAREREFNMRPVLPAFAGHVPQELAKYYPDAKITKIAAWSGYSDEYACSYLDPEDKLYPQIQKLFMEEEIKTYGTDHIYGLDLFNELEPPSYKSDYLARQGKQTFENLKKADPKAIWLQMTWLFYNEWRDWGVRENKDGDVAAPGEPGDSCARIRKYITSYPKDRSILLDYYCENTEIWKKTDKYYGVPYIWCYLGNFGGNTSLSGNLAEVNKRIENTFENGGSNFTGIGSTLEGFDCNTFMYEYVFEKAWNIEQTKDITKWIEHVADERSGVKDENIRAAWRLLTETVYTDPDHPGQCPQINVRPFMADKWGDSENKFRTYYRNVGVKYDNKDLLDAIELLLKGKSTSQNYQLDVVNFTRQLLGNYSFAIFSAYKQAYKKGDINTMHEKERLMLSIMEDVDRLCATQNTFLMGKWIEEARAKGGNNPEEIKYYEQNARNLLTTWGEKAALLNDYASRQWNGLVGSFYAQRYKIFFAAVNKAMIEGKEFGEKEEKEAQKTITDFEEKWWKDCIGEFPSKPQGDGVAISRELVAKWKPLIMANNDTKYRKNK